MNQKFTSMFCVSRGRYSTLIPKYGQVLSKYVIEKLMKLDKASFYGQIKRNKIKDLGNVQKEVGQNWTQIFR